MKHLLIYIFLNFLISFNSYGQEKLELYKDSSYYFLINDNNNDSVVFNNSNVKYFSANPTYLPYGRYVVKRINLSDSTLNTSIHENLPFQCHVINNHRDFVLYVSDTKYRPIENAIVKFNETVLKYDSLTKTYRIDNCKEK